MTMDDMPRKRRRLTIKTRITLFYTLLLTVSCAVMFALFLSGAQQTAAAYDEELLLEAMASAADAVSYQGKRPVMELGEAEDFGRVSFALYDAGGSLWHGHWPPFTLPFEDGAVRTVKDSDGVLRLCQDWLLPFPEGNLWLRGHIAADDMRFLQHASARRMLLLLPILLAIGLIGGHLMTWRALLPVARMARQAEGIAGGHDLTQRFDTGAREKPDEIGQLARTFNHMFDRLNASFARERQFTDDASHELRTPVAVITTACDYALSQDDPAEYREALTAIRSKAEAMTGMLAQLLQLARMDAGRVPLLRETVDLSRLSREAAQETALGRHQTLDLSAIVPDITVLGDELLLMRLVVNLTDNAVKFARAAVCISLQTEEEYAVLRVADDGAGMPPEVAEHVFDRFYQAAPDRSASGAGLGLPMARSICQLHGGSLIIERTVEEGTVFAARLPRE